MFKCSNLSLLMAMGLSVYVVQLNAAPVSWALVAPWCQQMDGACVESHGDDALIYPLADLVDAYYRELASPAKDAQAEVDFTDLSRIYEDLATQHGEHLSEQEAADMVTRLTLDMKERTALLRFAVDGLAPLASGEAFHHSELRHYFKELRYLKSFQTLNEQQALKLKRLNVDAAQLVKFERQALRLDVAQSTIIESLKQDLTMEAQLLRYLTLERENEGEVDEQ
ncbi:hypothetical protein BS049_RS23315 [Vibrio parahaemolyticus]|nr:hypothetical protein [Vibrio parahaemolyticus]